MIIIPDIHGRTFWKEPVSKALETGENIIFLGDYVDPYEYEGIDAADAFKGFLGILEVKKAAPEKVTLLLGNHDLHYLHFGLGGGRQDFLRGGQIKQLLRENAPLFDIAAIRTAGGKKFLFTHAGIRKGWLNEHGDLFPDNGALAACNALNGMWHNQNRLPALLNILSDVSASRWGNAPYGSPVWNDVEDMADDADELPGYYQIFGHSQQRERPVITDHLACLDVRRPFVLREGQPGIEPVEYTI